MAFVIESEVGQQTVQVGGEFADIPTAAADAFQRLDLSRSIAGTAPRFRLVKVGENLTQAESDLWASEALRLGFEVF
ncbi:MAG: hypothetical protein JNJ54_34965 [Myxococcaceae bacterium]|nr:hypothetical protein [Myxococcaceae bacterium]